jgi:hypothetical protein
VGATYISQSLVLAGIKSGSLPERLRNVVDVGPSYALMAVAGVLFYGLAGRWRWLYLAVLGAYVGIPVFTDKDFTAAGHVTSVVIGLCCYELVKGRPKFDAGLWLRERRARRITAPLGEFRQRA